MAEAAAVMAGLQSTDAALSLVLYGWRICNNALNAANTAEQAYQQLDPLNDILSDLNEKATGLTASGSSSYESHAANSQVDQAIARCQATMQKVSVVVGKREASGKQKVKDSLKVGMNQSRVDKLRQQLDRDVMILLLSLSFEQRTRSIENKHVLLDFEPDLQRHNIISQGGILQQDIKPEGAKLSTAEMNLAGDSDSIEPQVTRTTTRNDSFVEPSRETSDDDILAAVKAGDISRVQELAADGADLSATYEGRWTLLHHSVDTSTEMTYYLLETEPSLGSMKDDVGCTALHHCAMHNRTAQTEALLSFSGTVDPRSEDRNGKIALEVVLEQPWTEEREVIAEMLLRSTPNVKASRLNDYEKKYDCVRDHLTSRDSESR